jgi:uncharacterized ParB-like nuclease family protein
MVAAVPGDIAPAVCSLCGTVASADEPRPLDWMTERDARHGLRWVCAACARENVRSIEGKLDAQWW